MTCCASFCGGVRFLGVAAFLRAFFGGSLAGVLLSETCSSSTFRFSDAAAVVLRLFVSVNFGLIFGTGLDAAAPFGSMGTPVSLTPRDDMLARRNLCASDGVLLWMDDKLPV